MTWEEEIWSTANDSWGEFFAQHNGCYYAVVWVKQEQEKKNDKDYQYLEWNKRHQKSQSIKSIL